MDGDEPPEADKAQEAAYRAMKQARDGLPEVGRSARSLGVRIAGSPADIPVFAGNIVRPATGGMSVVFGGAMNLPKFRRPRALGGEGRDPVYAIETARILSPLVVRIDRYPHALVEPREECLLIQYESALHGTRGMWRLVHV